MLKVICSLNHDSSQICADDGVEVGAYRFFDDVKAPLVYLKGSHLLDDFLQQDVLFVIVTFNRQLQQRVIENRWDIINKQKDKVSLA